jgi:hypothetical protein
MSAAAQATTPASAARSCVTHPERNIAGRNVATTGKLVIINPADRKIADVITR